MSRLLVSSLAAALLSLSAGAGAAPQQADDSNFNLTYALELDTQGRVRGVATQPGSSPNRALAEAARSAAKHWRFLPELADGEPVAGAVMIPVCFRAGSPEPDTCDWQGPQGQRFTPSSVAVAIEPAARITSDLAIASN